MIELKCGCKVMVAGKPDAIVDLASDIEPKQIAFCDTHLKEARELIEVKKGTIPELEEFIRGILQTGLTTNHLFPNSLTEENN